MFLKFYGRCLVYSITGVNDLHVIALNIFVIIFIVIYYFAFQMN